MELIKVQEKMDGNLKIIFILFLFLLNCNGLKNKQKDAHDLISQNINILIDSVENFDMRKIERPIKFRNIEIKKIEIGLLDSVNIENNFTFTLNKNNFTKTTLIINDLKIFKSDYDLKLVKVKNGDTDVLFVTFSDLIFNKNEASIIVKKNIGIAMIKEKFYFVKKNNCWEYKKKLFLEMG